MFVKTGISLQWVLFHTFHRKFAALQNVVRYTEMLVTYGLVILGSCRSCKTTKILMVQVLPRVTIYVFLGKKFTLKAPLSTQEYKFVPLNYQENLSGFPLHVALC